MKKYLLVILISLIFSCKDRSGELKVLKEPDTSIFVNSINLQGDNSLAGRVKLFWSGQSPNGNIQFFEIAVDTFPCNTSNQNSFKWIKSLKTDSTFLFTIPKGKLTTKISFYVRAIDQLGIKDSSPACLEIPVKNSVPNILFDKLFNGKVAYDSVFSVFTLNWKASDSDGSDNLDSVYLKINNSKWVSFSKAIMQVTIIPLVPNAQDSSNCKILLGNNALLFSKTIGGLKMNDFNKLYIKSKDISNSFSSLDSSNTFYCKRKSSDLLYINAFNDANALAVLNPIFNDVYPSGVDKYNLLSYPPLLWNITFKEYIKLYKKIYWNNDDNLVGGSTLLIEQGSAAIESYLSTGGKILISTYLKSRVDNSPIVRFAPFDSLTFVNGGQARLLSSNTIIGFNDNINNPLRTTGTLLNIYTQYPKNNASVYYETVNSPRVSDIWRGTKIVATSNNGANGKPNQIFFSVPLHRLNGNTNQFRNLINQILNVDFAD